MTARIETSIEAFAELVAELDDPFADRASTLAAVGLDETSFARVRERWISALEASADAPDGAGKRFGDAYEHAARRIEAKQTPLLVPKGMQHFADLASTQPAFVAPGERALPFDPGAKPVFAASEARIPAPRGSRDVTDLRGTQPAFVAPRGPTLPFQATPVLSLEQYASLHVELSMYPAKALSILSRYRLDEEQRRRVEAYWQERMQFDAEVQEAWKDACDTFRAWLEARRGG
ncbi:hypothetical protein [Polyangium spumosum]|uniref:Uncharacterized protein n=1 Tax=Polyangium spumosum TaxID=889282 RepID=A0A6N7Q043_9BACT|nr:hypothetical protein [Polyangium spumosum]MRG97479.1 hypothetical protein [Polyangium spumosum]